MSANRPQNCNHQHLSHAIFDDDSRISLYHYSHCAREFRLFPARNNPLAFQQQDEKFGHDHCRCRSWICIHQITHETSSSGTSSGACVPTCGGRGDGQQSVWNDVQLLPITFGPCKQRHSAQFVWSVLPLYWTLAENYLAHDTDMGSSCNVIVFIRHPRSPWVRLLLSRTQSWTF